MAVFVEDLLLKPCYELGLVFTGWLAHSRQHTTGKKRLRLASHTGDAVTQAVQFDLMM